MDEQNGGFKQDKTARSPKSVTQLDNREIVAEARELHANFQQLSRRYEQAPASQRMEIREEMLPIVNRERQLREEYTGRNIRQAVHRDEVAKDIGFSR